MRPYVTAREIGTCGQADCPKGKNTDAGEELATFILIWDVNEPIKVLCSVFIVS